MHPNQSNQASAIILDMDGLMLDTERLANQAWRETFVEVGHIIDDDALVAIIGRNATDTKQILLQCLPQTVDYANLRKRRDARLKEKMRAAAVIKKPGLDHFLSAFAATPKSVATSTPREMALFKLDCAKLQNHFSAIVAGDEVACGKPDPEIYIAAARALNVPASQCVVLEDSMAGVQSALAAGMRVILIPDIQRIDDDILHAATACASSLDDAIPIVKSWLHDGT